MKAEQDGKILIEALPYIQKFAGKTIVIKYGGNAMIDEEMKKLVMKDIILLSMVVMKIVLVHGGGPEINSTLAAMGKEAKFINGLRYTDQETADVVLMVLAGKVNKDLVSLIHQNGGKAVGLCGVDGGMIEAKKIEGTVDLGYVGEITTLDMSPVHIALEKGFIPVIAAVGTDKTGQIYNINADIAAAAIAGKLKAEKLIAMTDVKGLLRNPADEESLIEEIRVEEIPPLVEAGIISGGMIPKIQSCVEGIRGGLKEAVILDGRTKHSILIELLSDKGIGTLIY